MPNSNPEHEREQWDPELWGADYNSSRADHPYGPVSDFLERLHKNEEERVVFSILTGFDLNDSRQHIPSVKFDISPLYFAVTGSPDHGIAPNTTTNIVKLILAVPNINFQLGYTRWDGGGNFCRTSPLMAAVLRVQSAKVAVKRMVEKDHAVMLEWERACSIVEAIACDPQCNTEVGKHERFVLGREVTNKFTNPLEELLSNDGLALDCVLLLLLHGGVESPTVQEQLEQRLSRASILAASPRKACTSQMWSGNARKEFDLMNVFLPEGEDFEVGEGYTEIFIPENLQWRWDLSSKSCARRLRNHKTLWNMGWRPESHPYFPTPFQEGARQLTLSMLRMNRYQRSDSECSRAAEAKKKELIALDLEADKFDSLDERDFLLQINWSEAQALMRAQSAHIRQKPNDLIIEHATFVRDGLHYNCMPLNIQLGKPAEPGEATGVRIAVRGEKGVTVIDRHSGINLREWKWDHILYMDVVKGKRQRRGGQVRGDAFTQEEAASKADNSATSLCTLRVRIEDDPGLPVATKKDFYGRTSKCQAGCWRFYVPSFSGAAGLTELAEVLQYTDGGAAAAVAAVKEDHNKWIEALQMQLDLATDALAAGRAQGFKEGGARLARLEATVDKAANNRHVYEYQVDLQRHQESKEEQLVAGDHPIKASQEFRRNMMKEAGKLWDDTYKSLVKRADKLAQDAHEKATHKKNKSKQDKHYARAGARRTESDQYVMDYFSICFKKRLENCKRQAEEEQQAGRQESADGLWAEHKDMVLAFWERYLCTGANDAKAKAPTLRFIGLLYHLHYSRRIAEDDAEAAEKLKNVLELQKVASALAEETNKLKAAAKRANELYTGLQKQGEEGENPPDASSLKEESDNAYAAYEEKKAECDEAVKRLDGMLDEWRVCRDAGIEEAWDFWRRACEPCFASLRAESKRAFALAYEAMRQSVPRGGKKKEIARAEECAAYALRAARRATRLHTQAEDIAATFWHVGLKKKVDEIELIFEVTEADLVSEEGAEAVDDAAAPADAPPQEVLSKTAERARHSKTQIVQRFFQSTFQHLMRDLMDREEQLDPRRTSASSAADGKDGTQGRDLQRCLLYRMQALGLIIGFLHSTAGHRFKNFMNRQQNYNRWAAKQRSQATAVQQLQLLKEYDALLASWRFVRRLPVEGAAGLGEEYAAPMQQAMAHAAELLSEEVMEWLLMRDVNWYEKLAAKGAEGFAQQRRRILALLAAARPHYDPMALKPPRAFAAVLREMEGDEERSVGVAGAGDYTKLARTKELGQEMAQLLGLDRVVRDCVGKLKAKAFDLEHKMGRMARSEGKAVEAELILLIKNVRLSGSHSQRSDQSICEEMQKMLGDFTSILVILRDLPSALQCLHERKTETFSKIALARQTMTNFMAAVCNNDVGLLYDDGMRDVAKHFKKVQAANEDQDAIEEYRRRIVDKLTLWKEHKDPMLVDTPSAPGLVGKGMFYTFAGDSGSGSDTGTKDSFESKYPIRLPAFGPRSSQGKEHGASDPCTWLPGELEIAIGPDGVLIRKKQEALSEEPSSVSCSSAEKDVLMCWPWCVLCLFEEVGQDMLEICVGGYVPPAPVVPPPIPLPDFIKLSWSAQFQGSPCQFDRSANAVHPLPVLEYRVERSGANGRTDEKYVAAVENVRPDVSNWMGTESFRWAEDRPRPQTLRPRRSYRFRVTARNAVGWGPASEWSEETTLLELEELEIEVCWFDGLNLPLNVTANILSFLKYDSFGSGKRLVPDLIHRSNGRLASIEEIKLHLYKRFFNKLKSLYNATGGHTACKEIRAAQETASSMERAMSIRFAQEATAKRVHSCWLAHREGMFSIGLASDKVIEAKVTEGLWTTILGPDFFQETGTWVGFEPFFQGRVGHTMFVRVNIDMQNANAVQCGRTALHLGHDDEKWAPVTLQGKHDDGTVDYEMKYATDKEGGDEYWFLSQPPVSPIYDPTRKCEIWMPNLFTEDQLRIWRSHRRSRIAAQEMIRARNRGSQFPPGTFVKVDVEGKSWVGIVLAINEDFTSFVAGAEATVMAAPDSALTELEDEEGMAGEDPLNNATRLKQFANSVLTSDFAKKVSRVAAEQATADAVAGLAKDSKGADNDGARSRSGLYTALHYAAAECGVAVLRELLQERGLRSHMHTQDACGCTPLHWAASVGKLENVKFLLEAGADDGVQNYMSFTPLKWAQSRNKTRIADQLEQLEDKEARMIVGRDDGLCADKINALDVIKTIKFLNERKSSKKEHTKIDIARVRRHIRHATLSSHQLTGFAAQLVSYSVPTRPPPKAQLPLLLQSSEVKKQTQARAAEPVSLPAVATTSTQKQNKKKKKKKGMLEHENSPAVSSLPSMYMSV